MLHNVMDPEVAKDPEHLIIYGGTGKAARSWECFEKITQTLQELEPNETLLIQSGKPVAVFETTEQAPRVLISNAMLVPKWATWDYFYELEQKGLIMYGQMTAGSWAYIGTQGILQGTYETLAAVAKKHFNGSLRSRLVLTAGLGEMGGAQPLAVTMNDGVALVVEISKAAIERRLKHGFVEKWTDDLIEALQMVRTAKESKQPLSIGLLGNAAEVHPELVKRGFIPDIVTDQTSAHDPLHGYYPAGLSKDDGDKLRAEDPHEYLRRAKESMLVHVRAMIQMMQRGAITFEYGNNIRQQAFDAGLKEAFAFEGFVPEYIRPMFCEGRGPFRWTSLVGEPEDIFNIDEMIVKEFGYNKELVRWIDKARAQVKFQGFPARVCWLGYGEQREVREDCERYGGFRKTLRPNMGGKRPPRHGQCGIAEKRNGEHERRFGCNRRLADLECLVERGRRSNMGLGPSRWRRGHRLQYPRRHVPRSGWNSGNREESSTSSNNRARAGRG